MHHALVPISRAFTAGALGALVNSIAAWGFGAAHTTAAFGVALAPEFTPAWLYPRLVWGGLWGLLLLIPGLDTRPLTKGLLVSLAPTATQLFVVFPVLAGKGLLGLDLGALTPAFVVLFNVVWGAVAAWWMDMSRSPRFRCA